MVRNEAFKQHTARLQSRSLAQKLPEYGFEEAREEVFLRELTSEGFRVDHMLGMIHMTDTADRLGVAGTRA